MHFKCFYNRTSFRVILLTPSTKFINFWQDMALKYLLFQRLEKKSIVEKQQLGNCQTPQPHLARYAVPPLPQLIIHKVGNVMENCLKRPYKPVLCYSTPYNTNKFVFVTRNKWDRGTPAKTSQDWFTLMWPDLYLQIVLFIVCAFLRGALGWVCFSNEPYVIGRTKEHLTLQVI